MSIKQKLKDFANNLLYPIEELRDQIIIGPKIGVRPPENNSEILITAKPKDIFIEKILSAVFKLGNLYKLRIIFSEIDPHSINSYVTYSTNYEANYALKELNKIEVPGCEVIINKCFYNKRIFVGGIPNKKNKDEIWQEFIRAGMKGITDIILYRSYANRNLNRGFVFVEFSTSEEAKKAVMKFNRTFLFGRMINVNWSEPIPDSNDSNKTKTLVLSNINSTKMFQSIKILIEEIVSSEGFETLQEFHNIALLQFISRRDAQKALYLLKKYFSNTNVNISWADFSPDINVNSIVKGDSNYIKTSTNESKFINEENINFMEENGTFNPIRNSNISPNNSSKNFCISCQEMSFDNVNGQNLNFAKRFNYQPNFKLNQNDNSQLIKRNKSFFSDYFNTEKGAITDLDEEVAGYSSFSLKSNESIVPKSYRLNGGSYSQETTNLFEILPDPLPYTLQELIDMTL